MNFSLTLTGCLVGFLIGLTGIGAGAVMTPFLILVIGARPVVAVGTDLAYGAVTKIAGAFLHWDQGTVDVSLVKRLAMTSVPAGLVAVASLRLLPALGKDSDTAIRHALGAVLILTALLMIARLVGLFPATIPERWRRVLVGPGTPLAGAIVGALVGFTSVGSGALLVPFLTLLFPRDTAKLVGTDLMHGAILVGATALAHAYGGTVDWRLVVTMLVGSLPGVALGSWMAPRVPAGPLRAGLAGLLLVTGATLV
jgi:uncharacterized membrane protein YfcA